MKNLARVVVLFLMVAIASVGLSSPSLGAPASTEPNPTSYNSSIPVPDFVKEHQAKYGVSPAASTDSRFYNYDSSDTLKAWHCTKIKCYDIDVAPKSWSPTGWSVSFATTPTDLICQSKLGTDPCKYRRWDFPNGIKLYGTNS